MIGPARTRVALDDAVDRAAVEQILTFSPQLHVTDYLELTDDEQAAGDAGDALIVACASFTQEVREYVAAARRRHPERAVVIACTAASNGYVSEAIDAGVDDIITLPSDGDARVAEAMSQQVAFTVEKAMARRRGAQPLAGHKLGR